jgi:hypothetical protein
VCAETFAKPNQATLHYEEHHAMADPSLVTVETYSCTLCHAHFPRRKQLTSHPCPAKQSVTRLDQIDDVLMVHGPPNFPTLHRTPHFAIYTDGSARWTQQHSRMGGGDLRPTQPKSRTPLADCAIWTCTHGLF